MPVGVAWMRPSASASAPRSATAARAARARRASAAPRGRRVDVDHASAAARRAPAIAWPTAAPAPPAPSSTTWSVRAPGRPRSNASREAARVGVVADRAPVAKHDRVDRAERGRLGGQLVELATTSCLHGCVTLSPRGRRRAPPAPARRRRSRRAAELVEVEQPVLVVEAERAASRSCSAGLSDAPMPAPIRPTTHVSSPSISLDLIMYEPVRYLPVSRAPQTHTYDAARWPRPPPERRATPSAPRGDPRRRHAGVRRARLRRRARGRDRRAHPHHEADDLLLLRQQGAAVRGRPRARLRGDPRAPSRRSTSTTSTPSPPSAGSPS